jgi:hypothetical protein
MSATKPKDAKEFMDEAGSKQIATPTLPVTNPPASNSDRGAAADKASNSGFERYMEIQRGSRGGLTSDRKGILKYTDGPYKGMTRGQADAQDAQKFSKMGASERDQYRAVNNADLERAAQTERQRVIEQNQVANDFERQRRQQMEEERRKREGNAPDYTPPPAGGKQPMKESTTSGWVDSTGKPMADPTKPPSAPSQAATSSPMPVSNPSEPAAPAAPSTPAAPAATTAQSPVSKPSWWDQTSGDRTFKGANPEDARFQGKTRAEAYDILRKDQKDKAMARFDQAGRDLAAKEKLNTNAGASAVDLAQQNKANDMTDALFAPTGKENAKASMRVYGIEKAAQLATANNAADKAKTESLIASTNPLLEGMDKLAKHNDAKKAISVPVINAANPKKLQRA